MVGSFCASFGYASRSSVTCPPAQSGQGGVPGGRVVLYRGSLGAAVAVDVAARHPCRALVTVAAFTSFPDEAQARFPWLPGRWLVRNRLDNLSKIAALRCPVLIAHGTADDLVPFSHGERLFAAAREPKRFFPLAGHGHFEGGGEELEEAVRLFLAEHP